MSVVLTAETHGTNVTHFGLLGDNTTDNSALFQSLVNSSTKGVVFYFPTGKYLFNSTVDLTVLGNFSIKGDMGVTGDGNTGTVLLCNFNGTMFNVSGAGVHQCNLMNLQLNAANTGTSVICLYAQEFVNSSFINIRVLVRGGTGISLLNPFTLAMLNANFEGAGTAGSTGLLIDGATQVSMFDANFTAMGTGLRCNGSGVSGVNLRFETSSIAMRLGAAASGAGNVLLQNSTFSGLEFEGNDVDMWCQDIAGTTIEDVQTHGSAAAPSGQSQYGLYLQGLGSTGTNFKNMQIGGGYSGACVWGAQGTFSRAIFDGVTTSNSVATGKLWDIQFNPDAFEWNKCDFTPRSDDTIASPTIKREVAGQWLGAYSLLNPMVEGTNFGRMGIAVPANATSIAITFTGDYSAGAADLSSVAGASGGSLTLLATYYYRSTIITDIGESGSSAEHSVTLSGAQQSATLSVFGASGSRFRRRFYRSDGTTDVFGNKVYQGYYESALGSNAAFVDTGAAFTAKKSPPIGLDNTSMQEPDTNYEVLVSTNWNSGHPYWSSKATSGFTINFPNAAPGDGSGLVSYLIYRPSR